jgi:hypothetical protein
MEDKMRRSLRRTGRILGASTGAVALGWLGYLGVTWARYGKASRNGQQDRLLDRFMPTYEVRERHETKVAAPAEVTYAVARGLDLQRSGLVRGIFRGRELLLGSKLTNREHAADFFSEVLALGWRVLAEEAGRELVIGAVTQPWKANVEFRGLSPEEFATFSEPGYAKIAWTLAAEPAGRDASIFRTETRVATTDPESRRRFRRYWSVVSPGVLLIRHESLRLVRGEAERHLETQHSHQ